MDNQMLTNRTVVCAVDFTGRRAVRVPSTTPVTVGGEMYRRVGFVPWTRGSTCRPRGDMLTHVFTGPDVSAIKMTRPPWTDILVKETIFIYSYYFLCRAISTVGPLWRPIRCRLSKMTGVVGRLCLIVLHTVMMQSSSLYACLSVYMRPRSI